MEKCTGLCESCVSIPNQGPHRYCMEKCRRCRNLGDVCSPAQSLEHEYLPMDYKYFYGPGYLSTGQFSLGTSILPNQLPQKEGFNFNFMPPNSILVIIILVLIALFMLKRKH